MASHPEFVFPQSGALPYLLDGEHVDVVLITSRATGDWIFPKGVIDPGETPESTAVRETEEEAGVVGALTGGPLGSYQQEKWGGLAIVEIYPLLVDEILDEWDEQDARQRVTVAVDEAKRIVARRLLPIVGAFERFLQGGDWSIEPA